MSDNVEKLLDIEAINQVALDKLVENSREPVKNRVEQLMLDVSQRNLSIWELFEVADAKVSIMDYMDVQLVHRDVPWVNEVGTMLAAAQYQACVEIIGLDLLMLIEKNSTRILEQTDKMNKSEIIEAAKTGVGKERRKKYLNA